MPFDLKPTQSMAEQAKLGLELRRQQPPSRRGGTAVGIARARDISARKTLSEDTVRRMYQYFARHSADVGKPGWKDRKKPSKGWQAWLLWGGDPGKSWATSKWKQIQREREGKSLTKATPQAERDRKRKQREWVRDIQGPMERMFAKKIAAYLKDQATRVSERFAEVASQRSITRDIFAIFDIDELINAAAEFARMSADIGSDIFTQAIFRGWTHGLEQIGESDLAWDPVLNPGPRFFGQMVTNVTQSTKDNVEQVILRGKAEGKTIAEVQLDLMRAESFSAMRALRIARTESARGLNAGSAMAFKKSVDVGVDLKVEWMSARDRGVRDSHKAMDGVQVAPGENFVLTYGKHRGASAPAPGQFFIPAEDVNCRCTISPKVQGWDDDD